MEITFWLPLVTIAMIILLSISSLLYNYLFNRRLKQWGIERQYHDGMKIKNLQQGLGSSKIVKLLDLKNTLFLSNI